MSFFFFQTDCHIYECVAAGWGKKSRLYLIIREIHDGAHAVGSLLTAKFSVLIRNLHFLHTFSFSTFLTHITFSLLSRVECSFMVGRSGSAWFKEDVINGENAISTFSAKDPD